MKLKPHPRFGAFCAWFTKHQGHAHSAPATFYRVAGPLFTSKADILTGIGAFKAGGRWNSPGIMKAIYASAAPETALAESLASLRYHGIPDWNGFPRVIIAISTQLTHLVDLTASSIASGFPERLETLMAEDWRRVMDRSEEPTTQAVGRAAFNAGVQAILVPSKASPSGQNLVVFPENLKPHDRLVVLNPELLEKLGR